MHADYNNIKIEDVKVGFVVGNIIVVESFANVGENYVEITEQRENQKSQDVRDTVTIRRYYVNVYAKAYDKETKKAVKRSQKFYTQIMLREEEVARKIGTHKATWY